MARERIDERGFHEERLARVAESVRADVEAGRCDGVALVVARGGGVVVEVTEGFADRRAGRRLAPDAVFATMSVGKQLTNVVALSLVERGLLRLHAPVAELIPEFGRLGKEKVTLYHLLTHTSGVASAIPTVPLEVLTSIERAVEHACGLALESLPGERVNYSILLAHYVIAALCLRADGRGRTFARMVEDDLLRPLGMNDTSFGPRPDLLARLCPIRACYSGIPALFEPAAIEGLGAVLAMPGCEIPGGGYLTTIHDLHRFAEMLRRGGELDGARILSPATLRFCARNHTGGLRNVLFDAMSAYRGWEAYPASIGVGFFVRGEGVAPGPFGVLSSAGAFGGVGAGSTAFLIDPELDLSISFLSAGLMEDSYHLERLGRLTDLVVSAIVR